MTTLVATQQALEYLSMSTQQERRKSKRRPAVATDFERDDDFLFVRKSKKPRTEEPELAAAGEKTGAKTQSSTTTTTTSSKYTIPETAEAEPSLIATTPAGPSISSSRTGQRKSARLKGSDGIPDEEAPQTSRRSTRNSTRAVLTERNGDGEESRTNGASKAGAGEAKSKTSKPVRRWEPSPTPRRPTESSKIALPMNDTPVINRNKEMRKKGGKSNRRSSLGSRGRRASSLIDNGQTAIPHREVDPNEFYKHIAGDLPEPRRMKQLLMWCGERALPQKPPHGTANSEAILAARAIQDQILKDFSVRSDLSNWFSRDDEPSSTAILQPNPRNMELDDKLASLEAKISRLQQEKQAWQAIRTPQQDLPPLYDPLPDSQTSQIELPDFALLEPDEGKIRTYLDGLTPFSTVQSQTQERIRAIQSKLELEVDLLADNMHKLEQRVVGAGRQADVVLALAARRLKERERKVREGVGTGGLGVMDVLRGLSGILERE